MKLLAFLLIFSAGIVSDAGAQYRVTLRSGVRARIHDDLGHATVVNIARFIPDTLMGSDSTGELHPFALATIARVDTSAGRSHLEGAARGIGFGFAGGAVLTAVLVIAGSHEDHAHACRDCLISATGAAVIVGGAATAISTVLGGLLGAFVGREEWVTVYQLDQPASANP